MSCAGDSTNFIDSINSVDSVDCVLDLSKSVDVTWKIENFSVCMGHENISLATRFFKTKTDTETMVWRLKLESENTPTSDSLMFVLEKLTPFSKNVKCFFNVVSSNTLSIFNGFELSQYRSSNNSYCISKKKEDLRIQTSPPIFPQDPDTITVICKIYPKQQKPWKLSISTVLYKADFQWRSSVLGLIESKNCLIYDKDNIQLIFKNLANQQGDSPCNNVTDACAIHVDILPNKHGWYSFVSGKLALNYGRVGSQSKSFIGNTMIWIIDSTPKSDKFSGPTPLSRNSTQPAITDHLLKFEFIVAVEKVTINKLLLENLAQPSHSAREDFLRLLESNVLSDVTLRTGDKSFPAHRAVLAARSEVFRAMFEDDQTIESRSGVVQINYLDNATVNRMLVYIYSDVLQDLRWDNFRSLYYAADKYAVHGLKQKCADVLQKELSATNIYDVLVFADDYSDDQLMESAVLFVQDHDQLVASDKWEELEKTHPLLTSRITRRLYLNTRIKKDR